MKKRFIVSLTTEQELSQAVLVGISFKLKEAGADAFADAVYSDPGLSGEESEAAIQNTEVDVELVDE